MLISSCGKASHLEKGALDVGILVISELAPGLGSAVIGRGQLPACLAPEHPLAKGRRIAFDLLRDQPLILFREDTFSRRLIVKECARHRFAPRIVLSASQIGTVIGLVRHGVPSGMPSARR